MDSGLTKRAAGAALIAVLSFGGGFLVGTENSGGTLTAHLPLIGDGLDATPSASADVDKFWKAWNALATNFVETHASTTLPTDDQRIWGAIAGLAASYNDPYTVFFPPKEAKEFQENISGNFGGIGVEIDTKDGVLTVISPLKGTPAEAAGLKAGDAILAINGKSTDGITVEASVEQIRGEKGTVVTLTIFRDARTFDVPVTRATIVVPESEDGVHPKAADVYFISLYQFTATSGGIFDDAFKRFKASGQKKLIVDLRGNPGGYLESAVEIASHFLPKGAPIVTEDHRGKAENEVHRSYGYNDLPAGTQVVVLIDRGSASASEILAGALKDNDVATLVGNPSFGKGSVQQLINIGEGSLKVTVARWLTPSGTSISDGGLKPDFVADRTVEDFKAGIDPQMDRAIQFLTTGK